ncbi:MAG: carboxypeptidase-like regulatory domain-containing protein [Prevotella sp.]
MRERLLSMILMLTVLFAGFATEAGAQQKQKEIRVEFKKAPMSEVLKKLQKASGYQILFTYDDVKSITVEGPLVAKDINDALRKIFDGRPFVFSIDGKYVSVLLKENVERKQPRQRQKTYKVSGYVMDTEQGPLPGASVAVEGSSVMVIADGNGRFSLDLPAETKTTLLFSYVGMKTVRRTFDGKSGDKANVYISLNEDNNLQEVVVNGMFERRKSSFTGSTTTFTKDELKEVGNQNLLKSLKNLDPSFNIEENLAMGSNPNAMPNVQLRGQTSFNIQGDYDGNQNQPLFILDGFETTLEKVNDLDMNRIQSVTLLKDAAAKAIYGSKAGNGVVVIQTIRPKSGEMRISYNGDLNIEAPDLTGYNLMNAQEKFDWEIAHDRFTNWASMIDPHRADLLYKSIYDAIASGVDTYWLSKPLRTGVGQKHTVQLEGGDSKVRYIVGASYNNIAGVMKGSSRNTLNINSTLSYTYKNMVFRNQLDYDRNVSKNSPYGSFSDYAALEPYFAPYDANGNVKQILGYRTVYNGGGFGDPVYNPIYNAQLNTKDQSDYTTFTENFEMDWHINDNFRFTGKFSYIRQTSGGDVFMPASHTMFADYDANGNSDRKGRYTKTNGSYETLSAQAGLS